MKGRFSFKPIDKDQYRKVVEEIRTIQNDFHREFNVDDIISNSKIFEVVIANALGHELIPGHSGSRDATDGIGEFEYKHFKETSSNHSWTFNDYTDNTIQKLKSAKAVIFAHVDDRRTPIRLDWYYEIPGLTISRYLEIKTKPIENTRKMINVSPQQIEREMGIQTSIVAAEKKDDRYGDWLRKIFEKINKLEEIANTTGMLTSNKFWEVLVASELNHNVLSEQGGRKGAHDAIDSDNNSYEYKVAKSYSWNFQDISDEVLKKYLDDKAVILAKVNKRTFKVQALYSAEPQRVVPVLEEKLKEKMEKYRNEGKQLRRRQVSLSRGDLRKINANQIL